MSKNLKERACIKHKDSSKKSLVEKDGNGEEDVNTRTHPKKLFVEKDGKWAEALPLPYPPKKLLKSDP